MNKMTMKTIKCRAVLGQNETLPMNRKDDYPLLSRH